MVRYFTGFAELQLYDNYTMDPAFWPFELSAT